MNTDRDSRCPQCESGDLRIVRQQVAFSRNAETGQIDPVRNVDHIDVTYECVRCGRQFTIHRRSGG